MQQSQAAAPSALPLPKPRERAGVSGNKATTTPERPILRPDFLISAGSAAVCPSAASAPLRWTSNPFSGRGPFASVRVIHGRWRFWDKNENSKNSTPHPQPLAPALLVRSSHFLLLLLLLVLVLLLLLLISSRTPTRALARRKKKQNFGSTAIPGSSTNLK